MTSIVGGSTSKTVERKQFKVAVNEIFGPTHQGEGPSCGQVALFLRLSGCDLKCGWCDTKYSWNFSAPGESRALSNEHGKTYDPLVEIHPMTLDQVKERILSVRGKSGAKLLVISGGEPTLQEEAVSQVALWWQNVTWGSRTEVETNGRNCPSIIRRGGGISLRFNVSPKLRNSGEWNARHNPIQDDALEWFSEFPDTAFKFVIKDAQDLDEVEELIRRVSTIHRNRVWLMPEGVTPEDISRRLEWLAPLAAEKGLNVTTRVHVLAYGSRRGV